MKFEELIAGKKEFKIAYIGGSITQGCGESRRELRYTSLFTTMLGKRYPDVQFTEINAGVGGTTSGLGIFRLKGEVLDLNPDFLFLEFSVNDDSDAKWLPTYEGIIREARRAIPNLPIMIVYCFSHSMDGTTRENPNLAVKNHHEIAQYYKIPDCYMGYDVLDKIRDYAGNDRFFTSDGIHPNDKGYESYVDSMMRDITTADFVFGELPEKLHGTDFPKVEMITADSMTMPQGWTLSARTLWLSPLHYACCDTPGTEFTCDFEGTMVGLYIRIEKDGGTADAYVDGEFVRRIRFWDRYCLGFDRNGYEIITDKLKYGKHTLKLVINDEVPSDSEGISEGHMARIAAVLAC